MEPATDTELLYHMLDLDALVKNMLDTYKIVFIQKAKYHISVV